MTSRAPQYLLLMLCGACGVRSALSTPPAPLEDAGMDASDAMPGPDGCVPATDACGPTELCGNGADDDCDGQVDELCPCTSGAVQSCFSGPPGRRHVGICTDGSQICTLDGTWGECTGSVVPRANVCNELDNLCDGCSAQVDCEINCPGPDDPRVPIGAPFTAYPLDSRDFFAGPSQSVRWSVRGGICDDLAPRLVSFDLANESSENAMFTPRLSGDYTVTLDVTTLRGTVLSCEYVVHVRAPGLRIEMCYPESETQDLDLYMHEPGNFEDWFPSNSVFDPTPHACSWSNCEAVIRGSTGRVDFGYDWSPIDRCENTQFGSIWKSLGGCANPRLDLDNNLSEGTGLPENINVDVPRDGETFRVMVQNFTGRRARPVVNIYCDGTRLGTYGAAPSIVPDFVERRAGGVGVMWRVVDVTTHVDAGGALSCDLVPLHPRRRPNRYLVTQDDPRY